MKNKRLKRNLRIFLLPCLLSTVYCLLSISGCGLNNPFTPPEPRGPTLTHPKNGDILGIGKVTFLWDIVPGREKYQLQISKSASFSPSIVDTNLLNSKYEYNFSDTGKYFWRVKVKYLVPSMWSKWSDVWSFVIQKGVNHPPVYPEAVSPPDGATDVHAILTLYWEGGDPDGDIVTYVIYFGTGVSPDSFDTIVDSSRDTFRIVSYSLTDTLYYNTNYYWKIKAQDEWGKTSAGNVWGFKTEETWNEPPNKPNVYVPLPPIYATKSYIFKSTTTDPEGDSIRYWFEFGNGDNSGWTKFYPSGQSGEVSYAYARLGTFYIKVKAQDKTSSKSYGESEWSDSTPVVIKGDSGTCWVAGHGDWKVIRISAKGSILCEFEAGGWNLQPVTLDVDPQTGWCWEASTYQNRVHRIPPACDSIKEHTFGEVNPSTPCVDGNGYCWYVFMWTKKLVKVDENFNIIKSIPDDNLGTYVHPTLGAIDIGEQALWIAENDLLGGQGYVSKFLCSGTSPQFRKPGFKAGALDVDQSTHWCWVPDNGNNRVAKISSDGSNIEYFAGFNGPSCVSVDSYTHCCWVADELNNRVVKLSEDGAELCVATGFDHPFAVEADPLDHGCWISDRNANRVVKLDADCGTLFTVDNILTPGGLSVNPNPDP